MAVSPSLFIVPADHLKDHQPENKQFLSFWDTKKPALGGECFLKRLLTNHTKNNRRRYG